MEEGIIRHMENWRLQKLNFRTATQSEQIYDLMVWLGSMSGLVECLFRVKWDERASWMKLFHAVD